MLSSLCFVRWPFCLFGPLCSALVPLLHCLFGVFEAPFSVSGIFQSDFFFGRGGLDEMRCEGPCVGRIGAIWEVVLFLLFLAGLVFLQVLGFQAVWGSVLCHFNCAKSGGASGAHSGLFPF